MKIVPYRDEKTGEDVPGQFEVISIASGRRLHGPATMASCEEYVRVQTQLLSKKKPSGLEL